MAEHNIIGQKGEKIACDTMRKKGFRVVDTNWKFGHLEMDVIAVNRKEIVFSKTTLGQGLTKQPVIV